MLHSQLKINLPKHPYLWDIKNIRQTYDINEIPLKYEDMMGNIQNLYYESEKVGIKTNFINKDIYSLLENIAENKISQTYTFVSQKLKKTIQKVINGTINFHTSAYHDDNGGLIDREYESNISWLVIPIIGSVYANPIKLNNINTEPIKSDILDKLGEKDINQYRLKCVGDNVFVEEKIIKNQSDAKKEKTIYENKSYDYGYRKQAREMNYYKMHRFGYNTVKKPQLYDRDDKPKPKEIANTYEYIDDNVGIMQLNTIYNFNPIYSGRINIECNENNITYFLSLMKHKKNMHITLHEITFI